MADITTTTTKKEGERMSELTDTIDRLEQWAEYWEPHQPAEFIADLRVLIAAAKSVIEAIKALKKAARYDCDLSADNEILYLDSPLGAVTDSVDVDRAIQILQEGQQ